ncbi:expressed unknown protein [Seminavis robusta]|uniref:Uncharacterized protein n=1 Tax=Seminavis robusta TaxID=568900 RepID=A0A9N8HBR1_9STRA|nr:expressed unknown protein [Seminavis robusta]|eukprot:Sro349_g123380.1 n/a (680) ;mRNA; r:13199-15238
MSLFYDREKQRRTDRERLENIFQALFELRQGDDVDIANAEEERVATSTPIIDSSSNNDEGSERHIQLLEQALEVLEGQNDFCLDLFPESYRADEDDIVAHYIPLNLLLMAGATEQMIARVCRWNREQLTCRRDTGHPPLHFALHRYQRNRVNPHHSYWIRDDAILEVARQGGPDVLSCFDILGNYPLSLALQHQSDNHEFVQQLIDLYPAICDGCHKDNCGSIPLGTAIAYQAHRNVKQLLINRLRFSLPRSHNAQELVLSLWDCTNEEEAVVNPTGNLIDAQTAQDILAVVLPQFQSVTLECDGWTDDGLDVFLRHFPSMRPSTVSPTKVAAIKCHLTLPYHQISRGQPHVRKLFSNFLIQTLTGRLKLDPCEWDETSPSANQHGDTDDNHPHHHASLLDALANGIRLNHRQNTNQLQEVQITGLCLPDVPCLLEYLLGDATPTTLNLFDLKLLNSSNTHIDLNLNDDERPINSHLRHLNLRNPGKGSYLVLSPILRGLGKLPQLKSLCLTSNPWDGKNCGDPSKESPILTNALVELVQQAPSLQELTMVGYETDHARLATALQRNTTLQQLFVRDSTFYKTTDPIWLDLLQHHNATLQRLDITVHANNPKLYYYLTLNALGRATCRNPQTPVSKLIQLLLGVPQRHDDTVAAHVYVYGLLRETPSIWCSSFREERLY